MRFRSSRRVVRQLLLGSVASVAPFALFPSLAQDIDTALLVDEPPVQAVAVDEVPVSRGFGFFDKRAPYSNPDVVPYFDSGRVPFEMHPTRLGAFDTANMQQKGTFIPYVGTMQTSPGSSVATGNQTYFTGLRFAPIDGLTLGLDYWNYDDYAIDPIGGATPQIIIQPIEISGRIPVFDRGPVSGVAQLSLGTFTQLDSTLFGGASGFGDDLFGSFKMPVTIQKTSKLQFHVTPGVSFFPDTINGADFFGTIYYIGGGVSYKPSDRFAFYGAIDVPFGSGGNTISSSGDYENVPVWTVGGRYNITPKVALDAFVTNGVGFSPATSILTHFPSGDSVLAGVMLSYSPGVEFPDTYRGRPERLTTRQLRLQQDGLTLGVADTLEPGMVQIGAWQGTDSHYGFQFSFGVDRDFQADFIFEDFADGTVDPGLRPKDELRYMVGPKLRFMDQNQGDPISLTGRMLFGRNFAPMAPYVGVFYLEGLAGYQMNEQLSLTGALKIAGWGENEFLGLGGGVNYEIRNGLSLLAEAHLVGADANDPTWALGARYSPPNSTASVDFTATNAIGRHGIGTILAQDSVNFSLGLSTRFSIR